MKWRKNRKREWTSERTRERKIRTQESRLNRKRDRGVKGRHMYGKRCSQTEKERYWTKKECKEKAFECDVEEIRLKTEREIERTYVMDADAET
jgi:hypothetical protein